MMFCFIVLISLINFIRSDEEKDICLKYITDYNICIQTAQRNWQPLEDNPMNYCCFLISIQTCRKLLRFKLCEVQSSSNNITRAIHDEIKSKLSKILFIGDVCQKYKDSSDCFNNIGAIVVFLAVVLFLTGIISFTIKRHRLIKDQLKNNFNQDQRQTPPRLPTHQFLHSAKRVRFL